MYCDTEGNESLTWGVCIVLVANLENTPRNPMEFQLEKEMYTHRQVDGFLWETMNQIVQMLSWQMTK